MKPLRRFFHPVMALVGIQLVWVVLVVLWVTWFVGKHRELKELASRYRPDLLSQVGGWFALVQGLLLLAIILVGVYTLFLFWRRQSRLYQQQREFITQLTHELKSPLASIQLHLETISLRELPPERLHAFVQTMLEDTQRLHSQIDNLLLAARIEQRRRPAEPREIDLSAFIQEYLDRERHRLPPGTRLEVSLTPELRVAVEPDELGTVLRNLLENAVLYSPGTPDIEIRLVQLGRQASLSIRDHGRGMEASQLQNVFKMFYRVEQQDERVRGTGLGLYIVQSVIKDAGGTVKADSDGLGTGCTITLQLPLVERKGTTP
jgi:signal transduction histidine kinase